MNTLQRKQHLHVTEKDQEPDGDWSDCAQVGEHIMFNTEVLDVLTEEGCQSTHYDLLLLCAAIEFADRRWKRPQTWNRALFLTVPVINVELWQLPVVRNSLEGVLRHLTCDSWQFNFIQAKNLKPCEWRQLQLNFSEYKSFVLAYSEGLDSRAVSALSGENEALCIRLANNRHRPRAGDSFFTQIPFLVKGRYRESSFRSRAFQFASITAIAAHIRNVKRIVVPESGQGALSPAMLPLHNSYADYRNHPTFFRKMEQFIQDVFGHQVRFEQPRLWSTKGETLVDFLKLPGKNVGHLTNTRSCWQTRHVVNAGGSRKQCGLCAACLLRRFSLHTAGIKELPDTYIIKDLATSDVHEAMSAIPDNRHRDNMIEYGSAGARHFQHFAEMAELSDDDLLVHALEIAESTEKTLEETIDSLKKLLLAHAKEWRSFLSAQGEQSFLQTWMGGGHNGRFE